MFHLLEHAQKCVGVAHLLDHDGSDARKQDSMRGMDILPVSEVSHLYAVGNEPLDKAQQGIHRCEKIGIACTFVMVHRGDERNEEYVLLLSFRKSALSEMTKRRIFGFILLWVFGS